MNYVDHTVWYHEDRLGDWMNKVSKYTILQCFVNRAKLERFDLLNRHDHYESLQQNLEFTSIMGLDPLQDIVDELIRVKPSKEYEEKLNALLKEKFALVNEKNQELCKMW